MYQFYYADMSQPLKKSIYKDDIRRHFNIRSIRPAMWEEHCLECSAPLCYHNCLHYMPRSDGRCKRFENGFVAFYIEKACCEQAVHVKFRKWANMMTIIFPAMLSTDDYYKLFNKNQKLGEKLKKIIDSNLPTKLRWEIIRSVEYLRRKKLRNIQNSDVVPDAFLFHGYSYYSQSFKLIIEVYNDHTPVYRTSLNIEPGENLFVINQDQLSGECWTANNLVKIYPENDLEVEMDILWCDFVRGNNIESEKPAEKVKCVVWDLDNTLWNGTLIESDNPEELKIRPGVVEIIHELDQRGIIQSIASKNDMDMAWPVVEKLGLAEYFLYPQIHWNAKSDSIKQIAKALNIGIDTFAFIDDSNFERMQVQSVLPQVRVYTEEEMQSILQRPEFKVMVTEESKKRRAMYQAEEKRHAIMTEGNQGTIDFLKKCHLNIHIFTPETESQILRCYELVVRTNQLNMSGRKYSKDEFNNVFSRPNHRNFAFSCSDDFGEYGIVGFGQYRIEKDNLIFTEFAMSCRVAGKYVESALFANLLEIESCIQGVFEVQKTKKNILLRRTLEEIGFLERGCNDATVLYHFLSELKFKDLVSCSQV